MSVPKPKHKRRKPKRKDRGKITKYDYQQALDWFGDTCNICNSRPIEMHHIRFRSNGGRGRFRNLMPLCKFHHEQAHQDRGFADSLREERAEAFGEYYYADEHDLHEAGLIEEATEEQLNNYFNEMGKLN